MRSPATEVPKRWSATSWTDPPGNVISSRLLWRTRNETAGWESMTRSMIPVMYAISVAMGRMNFFLAGVLKKISSTSMQVPSGHPTMPFSITFPASLTILTPSIPAPLIRVVSVNLETAAMLERASPLNPRDLTRVRSERDWILLVA
ncbi:MAG: hypothetical protein A4E38_01037 [Methanoregulaceae archaeon PtaB.Bin108]|nr:MAG: hypothetical protein A4E38_01037 [Methanoregulaceae archaeon PtaB.Bin108]